jgi:hypothetical protein
MIGSRVNAVVFSLAFASIAFAAEPEPAAAPPRGLSPASAAEPAPPQPARPAEQAVPDKPGAPVGPRVTVADLDAVDPDGVGLLREGEGGLPADLWAGSQRQAIALRIAQLPAAPNSPTMQHLAKRLLLTSAKPPVGTTPQGEPSLLALRLQKLNASGLVHEAAMLGSQSARTDSFARQAWAEALLLQGRTTDACGDATSPRQSSNDPYWLKLRALCYIAQNEAQAANLTLDVMRARNVDDDAFYALANALLDGGEADVKSLPAPTGIHFAMLARANAPMPAALGGWVPATPLLSEKATDPAVKLAAVERATLASIVAIDELRLAYQAEAFTPEQLEDPQGSAAKLSPPSANALFFQAIGSRAVPSARAAAFVAALQRAESQNRFALFSSLSAGIAQQMKPSPETAWLAPSVTRVLLQARRDAAAAAWLPALDAADDEAGTNALEVHLGLVRPSAENLARMPDALEWLGENALKPGASKDWLMDRATREIPLLGALGYTIPPDAQWAVSANSSGVAPAGVAAEALTAMTRAAAEGKRGETILNALVALGPGGPPRAQAQTIARVVKALIDVGQRDEARAIAIEAILAAPVRPRK